MSDASRIDDLSRTLGKLLPPGLADLKDDVEKNVRAAVQGALGNLDLVTREEFDVQAEVLQRTRRRLQALEAKVAAMESGTDADARHVGANESPGGSPDAGRD